MRNVARFYGDVSLKVPVVVELYLYLSVEAAKTKHGSQGLSKGGAHKRPLKRKNRLLGEIALRAISNTRRKETEEGFWPLGLGEI